ncbi:MAG: ABC transporter ATP-binding protein [Isosphaeraceae bacterium]|nr:ABC transporter ATP-binding protein [Isosphaeraceae bacterium]
MELAIGWGSLRLCRSLRDKLQPAASPATDRSRPRPTAVPYPGRASDPLRGHVMTQKRAEPARGFLQELHEVARRGRQVWRLVPPLQRWALAGAVVIMGVASAANTAIPLYLGRLVNQVNPETNQGLSGRELWRTASFYLGLIGGAYLLREGLNVLRRFLVENSCTRIDKEMCIRVAAHLMKADLSRLAREQVGALHGRISRSIEGFVRFLRISFLDFFPALLSGSFALVAALSKEPRIAMFMAGVIPVSLGLTIWQLLTQRGVRLSLLRSREAMDGTVVEQLSGLDYIRAADTHRQEVHRVARAAERRRVKELRHHFEMSLFGCGKALNEGFFHLVVIAFAIYLFVQGKIQYGDILTFSVLFLNVMAPLNEVHRFIDEAHESSLRVADLIDMLSMPTDPSFRPEDPREPVLALGEPLFIAEDLQVDYEKADGQVKRALDGVTMEIYHGETIGVAGRSGCGKTTWLRVLMRLVHPTGGRVVLGGVPLENITRETIGALIGYVGQTPFLFAGTIAENIAYGHEEATPEQIEQAARMACIHDEILEMPGGYGAEVAERGQNLSGGQRQRIALARIFLKNPPILILDEGTSALDNISERWVQEAIDAARADRTVILVAHRLSTLRDADRIFVFDGGRIVETGTYEELVLHGGVFTELVRSGELGLPSPSLVGMVAAGTAEEAA